MGFNGVLISAVANASVEAWQQILCIRERLSSQQLLEILCCYPLQQLGRFALCLWNFLCLPSLDFYYTYYYSSSSESDRLPYRQESSSSSSSSVVDLDDYHYHPHSD